MDQGMERDLQAAYRLRSGCPCGSRRRLQTETSQTAGVSPATFPGRVQAGVPRVVVPPGEFFRVRMGKGN